jgi:glucokinase
MPIPPLTTQTPFPRLLGDIGGTNARFAWQDRADAPPADVATYLCAQQATLLDAVRHYLAGHGKPVPRACGLAIATPITGDRVQMTNHHWSFSISGLQRDLALERLAVINDFTALALALPTLTAEDLHPVGAGTPAADCAFAVLGPGTGLGVSGLIPAGSGRLVPITGEGGHVSLAAADAREAAVVERLKQRFGHASAERALSGPGLVNLYEAACALSGRTVEALGPADVIARARGGNDPCCVAALDLFFGFLGSVAGNLALTLGARGGLYIGGGIAPRLLPELERSTFRERFEAKGRFRDYLAAIPTWVIHATVSPAFAGVARALDMP